METDTTFKDDLAEQIRALVDPTQFVLLCHTPTRLSIWTRKDGKASLALLLRLGRERIIGLYSPRDRAEDAIPVLALLETPLSPEVQTALNGWKKGRTLATPEYDLQPGKAVGMDTTATLRTMRLRAERKPR